MAVLSQNGIRLYKVKRAMTVLATLRKGAIPKPKEGREKGKKKGRKGGGRKKGGKAERGKEEKEGGRKEDNDGCN